MLFGIARVSTQEQNLDRQVQALMDYGVEKKNIFCDKISGVAKIEERPALNDMLTRLREGDTVVVVSFDRLARSLNQLLELTEYFNKNGITLVSLKENIDTCTPQGRLTFHLFASISEFEREIIKERQAEGIAIAKAQGRIKGRPRKDSKQLENAIALYQSKTVSVSQIEEITTVSRATLYRELKKRGIKR